MPLSFAHIPLTLCNLKSDVRQKTGRKEGSLETNYSAVLCQVGASDRVTVYLWNSDSFDTDDDNTILKPTALNTEESGRWLSLFTF